MKAPVGTLYIISTPIGNLEDISLRALRLLKEVAVIAAEDTRHTRKMLNHFEIATPCLAYHEHNRLTQLDPLLARLKQGDDIALVSDAGTPALSDPGWELVQACAENNIKVTAVPGASALLAALVATGFATYEFTFVGFPPRKKKELQAWCQKLKPELDRRLLVCYESPHRLVEMLETVYHEWGERNVAIARELTKLHEEIRREPLSAALAHFKTVEPRGEFTLIFAPNPVDETPLADQTAFALVRLTELKAAGATAKTALAQICAETGLPRRQVYDLWLRLER
jgi:16S rRNA (cytidine1402-2'-O)-methyltransferase